MQITKKFLYKYERWLGIVESMKEDIERNLSLYILYDINNKWGDWVEKTGNRPHIIEFTIGYSSIDVVYEIYAGYGETREFRVSVPIDFVLLSREEQEKMLEDKKMVDKRIKEEKTQYQKIVEIQELQDKITRLKQNLGIVI